MTESVKCIIQEIVIWEICIEDYILIYYHILIFTSEKLTQDLCSILFLATKFVSLKPACDKNLSINRAAVCLCEKLT